MEEKSVYQVLSAVDCRGMTEEKNGLTYLTWTHAWDEVKKRFPDATYEIYHGEDHRPYFEDSDYGIMCFTSVTIQGQTLEMWLPVMDGVNKAMMSRPYTYKVSKWENGRKVMVDKTVEAATMFDINKTIMRCLVKNLAMFGLGINIYAGEDIPLGIEDASAQPQVTIDSVKPEIAACSTLDEIKAVKAKYPQFASNAQFSALLNDRYQQINK